MKVVWKGLLHIFKYFPYVSHHYSLSFSILLACLSFHPSSYFSIFLVFFFSFLPLDQCPLCHQEMYKLSLSTPPRCVLPGAPLAHNLSMESTRDIRWTAPLCQLVLSSGQRQKSTLSSKTHYSRLLLTLWHGLYRNHNCICKSKKKIIKNKILKNRYINMP